MDNFNSTKSGKRCHGDVGVCGCSRDVHQKSKPAELQAEITCAAFPAGSLCVGSRGSGLVYHLQQNEQRQQSSSFVSSADCSVALAEASDYLSNLLRNYVECSDSLRNIRIGCEAASNRHNGTLVTSPHYFPYGTRGNSEVQKSSIHHFQHPETANQTRLSADCQ